MDERTSIVGMYIQGALEHRPGPRKLLLFQLPLGVLEPIRKTNSVASHVVLELLALAPLVFLELLEVGEALGGSLEVDFLAVDGLAQQLFSRDLYGRGGLVLDPWRAA